MSIILQFFPNGEFTKGVDTSKARRSRLDRLSDRLVENRAPVVAAHVCAEMNADILDEASLRGQQYISAMGSIWTYLCADMDGYHYAVENEYGETWELKSEHSPLRLEGMGELRPVPIGSSDGRIFTEPPPSRKKCLSMTKSMARNIRNAGFLLEETYGKDNLSFLTLTLPALPEEELAKTADNWGRMVDQFLKWLRSVLEPKGIPFEYVYCTEVQTKRLEKHGQYALHLHLLFRGRINKRSAWAVTPKRVRAAWVRCIKSVCSVDFEQRALENLQRIKRSASGYLSKYLSKGSRGNSRGHAEENTPKFNGHWGGMARGLGRRIKRATVRLCDRSFNQPIASAFINSVSQLVEHGLVAYYAEGCIPINVLQGTASGWGLRVGVGCLRQATYRGGLIPVLEWLESHGELSPSYEL